MYEWLDKTVYPFRPNYFDLPMGRMHYVDEGSADHAVVMVHGNPAWSFAYRKFIACLSPHYRCIAPDHLGFGLSDKPLAWDYLPEGHAQNLERLLQALDPASITLVVGDWGGPIGLSYAVRFPEKIRSIIITNTWMWPVNGVLHYEMFSRLMGGFIGRFLIKRYNFFVTVLMKKMFKARMAPSIHRHYIAPLNDPQERKGCWTFPRQIIGSSQWLGKLWHKRQMIADKPAMILWGMQDIAFRDIELAQWKDLFSDAEIHTFEHAGHFVQEEIGENLCPLIIDHLSRVIPEPERG